MKFSKSNKVFGVLGVTLLVVAIIFASGSLKTEVREETVAESSIVSESAAFVIEPATSSQGKNTYTPAGFPFSIETLDGWRLIDRSELLKDPNIAQLYSAIVEISAPAKLFAETDVELLNAGIMRVFSENYPTLEAARELCSECEISNDKQYATDNGDQVDEYDSMIDIEKTHITHWLHEGVVYELTTAPNLNVIGVDMSKVHTEIFESVIYGSSSGAQE